jgi:hypothetical protein
MNRRSPEEARRIAESLGPAEKLVQLIINFPDHLWHNRPGVTRDGKWKAATRQEITEHKTTGRLRSGQFRPAGPNIEAIEQVYGTLADIWQANHELAARLASYVMKETDWRDMKVVCAAFMLVQSRAGEAITEEQGGRKVVLFHDEDYRQIGEAMIKLYERGSNRMMNPKLIQRVSEVLSLPGVVTMNRALNFGNPLKRKPFVGRYYHAVTDWLEFRETNLSLLEGLRKAGYASTVKNLARMVGYKPKSKRFFEVLGWRQKQAAEGHRSIGLTDLEIRKLTFEGLSEREICEKIVAEQLGWKQVMGMLPKTIGLTPAIFVALLDQFSDKDLAILTPTLEEFGLLEHEPIKRRWQEALAKQEDQRTRNIAKNIRDRETARKLEDSADAAVVRAVAEATKEADLHIMFLIDTSGSMEGAIETSKQALSMIVQGFPPEKLHIASFNTVGTILKPRHHSAAGIQHMLKGIGASGGTVYGSAITAFRESGVRIPPGADLILFAVGDEAGEQGELFARSIRDSGYAPKAIAHIVNVSARYGRGQTVRDAAEALHLPYTEVNVEQFTDVYQVQRTLKAVLEAQPLRQKGSLIEKIMQTELLVSPY